MRHLAQILMVMLALTAARVQAQDVPIQFGQSLRLDGSSLEVTADSFAVDQTTGVSEFSGNVVAVQGDMRIASSGLRLEYLEVNGRQRIGRVFASGGVLMATSSEVIEAREAIYDLAAQSLEMIGNVMLVQGSSVLSGERFVADLAAGTGRMVGRVRTVIRLD